MGYIESNAVSPSLIQNCINNYLFESTAGWIATSATSETSSTKPKVQNVYSRFDDKEGFKTIAEDFYDGNYDENNLYKSYMELSL